MTDPDDMIEDDLDLPSHPGMPCFVANEAEFRAAVEAGIESARTEPTVSLEDALAEIYTSLEDR